MSWAASLRRRAPLILAGAALLGGGVAALALGPLAAPLVDQFADGERVWRLGRLQLEGVSGPHLGRLQAERALLRDAQGVWLRAEDVRLRWAPLALLTGEVAVELAAASRVEVLRRPELLPDTGGEGAKLDFSLKRAAIGALRLAPGVAGETEALFTAEAQAAGVDGGLDRLALEVVRTDAPSDRLSLVYDAREAQALRATLQGAPGGAFAALLELPEGAGVRLEAAGRGEAEAGALEALGFIGETRALAADLTWGEGAWRLAASVEPGAAPVFAPFAGRLGGPVRLAAAGDLPGPGMGRFTASGVAPNLELEAQGALREGLDVQGPLTIGAESDDLGALLAQPELGGAARFDGEARLSSGRTQLRGALGLSGLRLGGLTLAAEGPIALESGPQAYTAQAELAFEVGGEGVLPALLEGVAAKLDARFDRREQALMLRQLRLDGPNLEVEASGGLQQDGRISGRWALPRLAPLLQELSGSARGRFGLQQREGAIGFSLTGEGRRLGAPDWLAPLLGERPELSLEGAYAEGVVRLSRATLLGRQLRAGASGVVRDDSLDLRLEASARGPLRLGGALVEGAFDATGRAEGPLTAPAIQATAMLDRLEVAALAVENAALTLRLGAGEARAGEAALAASLNGQPLRARADLRLVDGVMLDNLEAQAGRLLLSGQAGLGPRGPAADLRVSGRLGGLLPDLRGGLEGRLEIAPNGGEDPVIALALQFERLALGGAQRLRLEEAGLQARGPLSNFAYTLAAKGQAGGLPLALEGAGEGALTDGLSLSTRLNGVYAQQPVGTLEPLLLRADDAGLNATGLLRLDGGRLALDLSQQARALRLEARLQQAPLVLLSALTENPLAGEVSGAISLEGEGQRLQGEADLQISGARFANRSRDPVDATLQARLNGGRVQADLTARSRAGLTASIAARLPVNAAAAPFQLGLAEAPGVAEWRIEGPIGGVWDLVSTLDQRLTGRVAGEGVARIAPGALSGEGRLALAEGAFEDKLTGLRLLDLNASLRFDADGARLEALTARGPEGGAVRGDGAIEGPERGVLNVTLEDLQLVDRPDIQARGDGKLRFAWDGAGSRLSGALLVEEANLQVDELRDAAVTSIEVVEVNRPGDPPGLAARRIAAARRGEPPPEPFDPDREEEDAAPGEELAEALGGPTRLDLAITAPRRIFTRGRGLDAEWALDLRVEGTLEEPRVLGEATLQRGTFALAGRTFDIERGVISFDGDPLGARMDLAAENVGPDLTVGVELSGSVQDPELQLTSNPDLPEDEILPQFLFGREAAELSPLEAAQLAASLATLAGRSSFDLVSTTRELIRLDRLDIRQEEGGVAVAGGRYLTRDVYLELSRGALGETATKVEWQIRPQLYLVSSFLSNGDQRLSVRWRKNLGERRGDR